MMIPVLTDDLQQDFSIVSYPTKTYRLDLQKGRINGQVDGLEAVKQSVHLILQTERFYHEIYSWNYGVELENKIGQPFPLIYAEIEDAIMDALIQDDRVLSVNNFSFSQQKSSVQVSFSVETTEGQLRLEQEVTV